MNKFKTFLTVVLLLLITVGVVFVPQIVGKINEKVLLNEVVNRNYSVGKRPKLTKNQVARLYYNREIDIDFSLPSEISDEDERSAVKNSVIRIVYNLFQNDAVVFSSVEKILESENYSCSRKSILTKIDNQPTALNFINYGVKDEERYFEILYEEKTETVIGLASDICVIKYTDIKEIDNTVEKIDTMICNYYENTLHFNKDEYIVEIDNHRVYVTENGGIVNMVLGCSLLQEGDKLIYIEQNYN